MTPGNFQVCYQSCCVDSTCVVLPIIGVIPPLNFHFFFYLKIKVNMDIKKDLDSGKRFSLSEFSEMFRREVPSSLLVENVNIGSRRDNRLEELKNENTQLKMKVRYLEFELSEKNKENQKMKDEVELLKKKNDNFESILVANSVTIKNVEKENVALRKRVEELERQLIVSLKGNKNLSNMFCSLEDSNKELVKTVFEQGERLEKLEKLNEKK